MEGKKKLKIEELLVAIILFIMATIAFINVLSRYIFHFSFAFTEEIEVNLFIWLTVIGIAIAFERGSHLGMVTLYKKLPKGIRKGVAIISGLLSTILFLLVDIYAIKEIYQDITLFHATSEALGIPFWVYTIGIPIFSVFIFIRIFQSTLREIKNIDKGGK